MNPESAETLWPASCVHGAPDPCSLQHGAAGTLGALTRSFEVGADPRLAEAITDAGHWILRRLEKDGDRPPGLYFGTAGAAWAVLDAGLALGDAGLVEGALAVADRLPESVPSPDVTHGTAGLGLAALHLWSRTGEARFAERALAAAGALAETVEERDGGLDWSTPAEIESKLAGARYYGFAHGVSGVGCFLLACAGSVGGDAHRALAAGVGETLLDTMIDNGRSAMWAASSGDIATAPYWCHGSAGIGGFLGRLGQATGDGRFQRAAEMSARAVMDNRWRAILGQCHGLAGNGDFLLDMAALTGTERHRDDAWRLAQIIVANRAHRGGRVVFPDEQGGVSTSWGTAWAASSVSWCVSSTVRRGCGRPTRPPSPPRPPNRRSPGGRHDRDPSGSSADAEPVRLRLLGRRPLGHLPAVRAGQRRPGALGPDLAASLPADARRRPPPGRGRDG